MRASAPPIERSRSFDVAEHPQCIRKVKHRHDAGVLAETKGQIVVSAGLKQRKRAFQMAVRFGDTLRRTSA